jgi:preprotein translocase subunit SecG
MFSFVTGLHVLICLGLIIVVLLQTGKGTGMASVFGGSGGGSVMGGKGFGGVLARATAALAILFMLTSITLSLLPKTGRQKSVLGEREARPPAEAPAGQTTPSQMPTGEAPMGETPPAEPAQPPAGQ